MSTPYPTQPDVPGSNHSRPQTRSESQQRTGVIGGGKVRARSQAHIDNESVMGKRWKFFPAAKAKLQAATRSALGR
jgi:hypothetical protein